MPSDVRYVWDRERNATGELIHKTEGFMDVETSSRFQRAGWEGRSGTDMYTRLQLECITSKDLLHHTTDPAQCHVAAWAGGELGENGCVCVCVCG